MPRFVVLAGCSAFVALAVWLAWPKVSEDRRSVRPRGVTQRRGQPQTQGRAGGPGKQPQTPRSKKHRVRIEGVVLGLDGRPFLGEATVEAVERRGASPSSTVKSVDGRFHLVWNEVQEDSVVLVTATVTGLRSLPWAARIDPSSTAMVSVLLRLRPAGRVQIRAIDEQGDPVPQAEFLASSFPVWRPKIPTRPWEQGRSLVENRIVVGDGRGEALITVREGPLHLHSRRPGGVWGKVATTTVTASEKSELVAAVGREPVNVQIRIVDEKGMPVERAWLRLEDRSLRFGHALGRGETSQFVTGPDGTVALRIDESRLPLQGVAGSTRHDIRELTVDSTNVAVVLKTRLRFRARLRTADGEAFVVPVRWSVSPSETVPLSQHELSRGLQVMLGEFASRLVAEGEYEFFLRRGPRRSLQGVVPGGFTITKEIPASAAGARLPDLDIRVPPGRRVSVRRVGQMPELVENGLLGTRVSMLAGGSERPFYTWDAKRKPHSDAFWLPDDVDSIVLAGDTFPHLPWNRIRLTPPRHDGVVEVDRALLRGTDGAARVLVRLVGGGRPVKLRNVHVSCAGGSHAAKQINDRGFFGARTDSRGECKLLLPEGEYSFRPSPQLGDYPWKKIQLRWRDGVTVDLALWN